MKLLQRTTTSAKKNIVLITSEPAIRSIAGLAGVHVSATLHSKPEIPKPPARAKEQTISADDLSAAPVESAVEDVAADPGTDTDQPSDGIDTIEIDNTKSEPTAEAPTKKRAAPKFKIPDFSSFRLRMMLAVFGVILLVVGWFFGFVVLPKATITISTDTSSIDVAAEFTVNSELSASDIANKQLAATKVDVVKEDEATVTATGEKDVGQKATGLMTITNCIQSVNGVTIPAGTGFSNGGVTFVTDQALELSPSVYAGGSCISADFPAFGASKDVSVTALQSGEASNISARSYTSTISGILAFGSNMTGGTTQIATVVSAEDIQNAKDQVAGSSTAEAIQELRALLEGQGLQPVEETLSESQEQITQTAEEDEEVAEVKVTRKVTYSLSGVSSEDISQVLDSVVQESIADKTQNIRSNGAAAAVYRLVNKVSETEYTIGVRTVATTGQEFDQDAIKQEVIGKELGEIRSLLEPRDGIQSVDVEYSPFWVFQVPSNTDKITIIINEL